MPVYVLAWTDLIFDWEQDSPNVPALGPCGAGGWHARKWGVGDRMFGSAHIDHRYAPGTQVHLHMHWTSDGADVTNPVRWRWTIWGAKGHDQAAFSLGSAGAVFEAEQVSGGKFRHMITETVAVTIAGLEPDFYLLAKIERIANGGTESANGIFAWRSDIHHQVDVQGSKNRQPPFYQ